MLGQAVVVLRLTQQAVNFRMHVLLDDAAAAVIMSVWPAEQPPQKYPCFGYHAETACSRKCFSIPVSRGISSCA
jgi:hypothetical protein